MTGDKPQARDYAASLKRHGATGTLFILILFGGLGLWTATTEISGAVIASGSVVVEGNSKKIQHRTGGVVAEILARNGQKVKAGDVLVVLDATEPDADLAAISARHHDALIRRARLQAELDRAETVAVPKELAKIEGSGRLDRALRTQQQILETNTATLRSHIAQVNEQIGQLGSQKAGLESQRNAVDRQIAMLEAARTGRKNPGRTSATQPSAPEPAAGPISPATTPTSTAAPAAPTTAAPGPDADTGASGLDSQLVTLESQKASTTASIAQVTAAIAEKRLQITQLNSDYESRVLTDLEAAEQVIAETGQLRKVAQENATDVQLRAPVDGIVHESTVDTVGGILPAAETVMSIVPLQTELQIKIRVSPLDVDKVTRGGEIRFQLPGYDRNTTPELAGRIAAVSPDQSTNAATGEGYYEATAAIPPEELAKLPEDIVLVPGMPVETFVTTGERTVLSYLLKPLQAQINRAFRED